MTCFYVYLINSRQKKTYDVKQQTLCNCKVCKSKRQQHPNTLRANVATGPVSPSLSEVLQDTKSRGVLPSVNQPNHVSNFWMGTYSHPTLDDKNRPITNVQKEDYFYLKPYNSLYSLNNSQMHLTSRFASV